MKLAKKFDLRKHVNISTRVWHVVVSISRKISVAIQISATISKMRYYMDDDKK